ncbi:hypothetical protein F157LOC_00765 [Pectobacterium brasiliense]|uniref:hypothetical protein n=1 Tax=Pectobacterium brasiliense TaxID=180957 RepID=UPI000CE694BA|nr:hypothetical protein [Pectobacterium brasiliense]PPE61931.1 hypothetical protein F157LOC_00765 [Pectobacterium brasiliense]
MSYSIQFQIPSESPESSVKEVWELQCKLDTFAQELYGPRNQLILLKPPVFNDDPDAPQVRFGHGGAFAELDMAAAKDWSYCIYQLAHETVHLLDPRPRPPFGKGSNYLEEGVAVEFSLLASMILAPNPKKVGTDSYKEARRRILKIGSKNFHQKIRNMREAAGHFSDVSSQLVEKIAPQCRGLNSTKLVESFYS